MPRYGAIVVIKRNGTDGIVFPLTSTSCLFGRKSECDIRMRLPWVSNEHCKIEINENKEAVLTNLSTVNPTQLNGASFEQPVPLKHGDVLTIIDRSFRFEYPLQATPKKRRSRSAKDETLQQVAEEELLQKQSSGAKSVDASDDAECEEKNANGNQQTPKKNLPGAFPVKLQTLKSSQRIHHGLEKQTEMSPFNKLYGNLKKNMEAEKPLHRGTAKGEPGRVLPEPSVPICDIALDSLAERKETGRVEECIIVRSDKIMSAVLNKLSAGGRTPRHPQTPISRVSGDSSQSPLQDPKEFRTPGRSKSTAATPKTSRKHRHSLVVVEQCSIVRLECSLTRATPRGAEGAQDVLSTPTSRRKSPRSLSVSPPKESTGKNPGNADTPRTPRRRSLKLKPLAETPARAPELDIVCRCDDTELPLPEDKCLKQRRNSKQPIPGICIREVLEKFWDRTKLRMGYCESPSSLSNSKSPRRNSRENKELLEKSAHSEALASEGMLASPGQTPGRKRGRPRTSGVLAEAALETSTAQEHHNSGRKASGTPAELALDSCHQNQDLEDASATTPRRASAKRRSGSAAELRDTEPGSETKASGLLPGEDSGKTKRISQKRKSGETLPQTLGKRKRVSFGGHLSPELFDKSLPPNSPLKRGALPARMSLPCGDSPRAVLKKDLKHQIDQEEKRSPKNSPAQQSPGASSPVSGKATPKMPSGSPAPFRRGCFSISQPPTPFPIAEEKDAGTEDLDPEGSSGAQEKTPKSSPAPQDAKVTVTPTRSARGAQLGVKGTARRSRGGAVAALSAKRRSGASSANLLVAKSWAEVVKLGVPRPLSRPAKKSVCKGRALKRINHPPKTPEKKIKDHFSTGHAASPATIVVGRAYSTSVRSAGHVPKVVKNPQLKVNMDMDESFTGVPEMFQTPENQGGRTLPLAAAQNADFTPPWAAGDTSDLHTPEESGEMMVSPLNNSDASEQKQENPGIFSFLGEESSPPMFDEIATKTPEKRQAVHKDNVDSLEIIPEKPASLVKSGNKRKTPKQKVGPVEAMSSKRKILRTPEQRSEPGEVLSGIKRLMKTPRQKSEPAEVLSGIRELMKTPNQKLEPAEVLSGIRELLKTPNQKLEPVEVLSGIKELLKTPKQKLEPAEVLSGIRELLKTPNQKLEPAEALSGIKQLMKTPKQKPEPVEDLSGIKQLMKTPKQKLEPVEALSGIKQLMKTPKQKPEPVEDLSGIKQLLKTPQQELEPVTDEIALQRLLETPVERRKAVKAVPGVTSSKKTPKLKSQPVEDMVGISRIFQTPKEKVEPIENMFGISRLMKSPKEKSQPVEDFVGLQRLMAEPRQKSSDSEVDYAGMTEMFGTPEEMKVRSVNVKDSPEEIAPPGSNSSHKREKRGKVSQGEDSQQKDSTGEEQPTQRPRRGRGTKAVPPAAAKPSESGVGLKELQSPGTQEEMGVMPPENKGRGRRTKRCIQGVVPKHPDLEGLNIVSSVEPSGAAQRPGRGKRKELKEVKHPNENLESCVEDSSVLQKAPANTKESLQDCGISETEDDPGTKTGPGNVQNEICQLQTGLNNPDSKANDSGIEDSEEVLLSPRRRCRGAENTEPVIPAKRGRRARNDQGKAASPGDHGATRKLRKEPSPKVTQPCDKAPEAVTAQESENGTKLELKAAERRGKSLRSTRNRKHSAEIKTDTPEVALENTQNIQKTEETSTETDAETQSHVKNEMKESQGCETENAQENTTEAARRLKSESPSAETNKMPVCAQNMEANRARNRRGKKDSLEQKADEFTENVNSQNQITPKFKSETEVDEASLQDSLGSVCVSAAQARKEQPSPAADSASPAQGSHRRMRNGQGILRAKQTEILQGNPAQRNALMCTRGRGKKVNFQLEEGSSKAIEGKSLPEGGEGMTDKDNQHENSKNPPSQGRRGRRKQLDSIPHKASPALMENQTLSADQRKDQAVVQEQGPALGAAPSAAEGSAPRRGRRREAAAASQSRSPSVRTRRGALGGDAKKVAERENENPALGNQTSQAKVNASARDRRKKMDPAAETASSTPLQSKCDLSETKDGGTDEEQGVPLEAVSCAKEKPAGRGRRKEAPLASHTANSISLRGKRRLPAGDGGEAPKEEQNVPSETCDPSGKENQLRRGRRKEVASLIEAKSSIQENQVPSKRSGRKNSREAKQSLDNSSQENTDPVKGSSGQATTSLALSPTSTQGLPEDGKDGLPEEQSKLLDIAPPAIENPSRVGRKKTTSSTLEETISISLRGKPNLPRGRGQKSILIGSEGTSQEKNPCQGRARQLRNKRRKVEFPLEAAISTSPHKSSDLPENGNTLENQDLSGASSASEENKSGKGQEGDPAPQAAPTSRRRKGQLPAEDVAPKKFKSGNDENGPLQRGRRNKTKLGEEDARTGGMERRTRSSTRTRK
ncbi:PREDICTED: antigen KI-67 isoform X2 [Ficedula albicollis]|uniref:Marker of proliferation Ki-67 n=1 Tax=Ficedula albicollis TaxID=59894 RepID=A0A803W367_FICAL|nr:PREDICTED: antigen KI-67 isoform X2 [Ficedula albicollis]